MDFITAGIIASSAYDIFKKGLTLTAQGIKERLSQWITDDVIAEAVAREINKIGINSEMSETAITKQLNQSGEIIGLIRRINLESASHSHITNVVQTHSGSGDNVAGNKVSR